MVNNKRVFYVAPHAPHGFVDALERRPDIRLDRLEQNRTDATAEPVLAAAHAYQASSTRQELVQKFHVTRELLQRTPNLLFVSAAGAGYDTVDVKACTEAGVLVVNQTGGNKEAVAEHVLGMVLCLSKRIIETDRAMRRASGIRAQRLHGRRRGRQDHRHRRPRQCGQPASRELCRGAPAHDGAGLRPVLSADTRSKERGATKVELDDCASAPISSRSTAPTPRRRATCSTPAATP